MAMSSQVSRTDFSSLGSVTASHDRGALTENDGDRHAEEGLRWTGPQHSTMVPTDR